jgi:hypothetical protein
VLLLFFICYPWDGWTGLVVELNELDPPPIFACQCWRLCANTSTPHYHDLQEAFIVSHLHGYLTSHRQICRVITLPYVGCWKSELSHHSNSKTFGIFFAPHHAVAHHRLQSPATWKAPFLAHTCIASFTLITISFSSHPAKLCHYHRGCRPHSVGALIPTMDFVCSKRRLPCHSCTLEPLTTSAPP